MAPHIHLWILLCQTHRIVKGQRISHQGGRCHNAPLMGFYDGAIDTRRKPEIVGVDDETWHCGSLAGEHLSLVISHCSLAIVHVIRRCSFNGNAMMTDPNRAMAISD